jgi:OHCU decarboxylase
LNELSENAAVRELQRCCGSRRWAQRMAQSRPFASREALAAAADAIWADLGSSDWLEAFAAHPRIGDRPGAAGSPGSAGNAPHRQWSEQEQAGVTDDSRQRFLELNRDYEARFGHIFIVCATGKSGDEMHALLRRRMRNNPQDELREAAEQQRQITRLRLAKLIDD